MNKPTLNHISSLSKSYNQLARQLKRSIESGKFYQWSRQKRQFIVARLLHYLRLLRSSGVKIAATAGIAIASTLTLHSQPPMDFDLCDPDPFIDLELVPYNPEIIVPIGGGFRMPLTADLDNDGYEELVVITYNEGLYYLQYFDNSPMGLEELTGPDNPLDIFNELMGDLMEPLPPFIIPSFGDVDLDGDLDLVFGQYKGEIICFLNEPSIGVEPITFVDPGFPKDFNEMTQSILNTIQFADIDSDCDEEMIIMMFDPGPDDQRFKVYDPIGNSYFPSESMSAMFDNIDYDTEIIALPTFVDLNGDNVDEIILSYKDFSPDGPDPEIISFVELYNKVNGVYELVPPDDNPFDFFNGIPAALFLDFGDLDGDDFLNLYVGYKSDELDVGQFDNGLFCLDTPFAVPGPCVEPIPTLGQWGVYILGLCLLILGTLGLSEQRSRKLLSFSKQEIRHK